MTARVPAIDLREAAGVGVAGNFAGHLEQAGEAADFARVAAVDATAPKGIFPWYMPHFSGFLGEYPVSPDRLLLPDASGNHHLQIEPEVGVVFATRYDGDRVCALTPVALGAFNDCSIRRANAAKISHKKNWGPCSKGLGPLMPVGDLEPGGGLAGLRIASFLRRDGEAHAYGIDSAAADYSYAGATLVDWIVDRLVHQAGSDDTPLEPVGDYLALAGRPGHLVVGIGATRYTPLGEATFLDAGDESVVVVYDARIHAPDAVARAVAEGREHGLDAASALTQIVAVA